MKILHEKYQIWVEIAQKEEDLNNIIIIKVHIKIYETYKIVHY